MRSASRCPGDTEAADLVSLHSARRVEASPAQIILAVVPSALVMMQPTPRRRRRSVNATASTTVALVPSLSFVNWVARTAWAEDNWPIAALIAKSAHEMEHSSHGSVSHEVYSIVPGVDVSLPSTGLRYCQELSWAPPMVQEEASKLVEPLLAR